MTLFARYNCRAGGCFNHKEYYTDTDVEEKTDPNSD